MISEKVNEGTKGNDQEGHGGAVDVIHGESRQNLVLAFQGTRQRNLHREQCQTCTTGQLDNISNFHAKKTTSSHGILHLQSVIMTAQILASELGNLIQESKRKHTDLRNVSKLVYCFISSCSPNYAC